MKKQIQIIFISVLLAGFSSFCQASNSKSIAQNEVWSREKANSWYNAEPWISGCNFQPSSAINQIEMWSDETFDAATIDKELGWAEGLGFNTMRVFLSSVVWKQNPDVFKKNIDRYLAISSKHGIKTMFVFFDDCWNPESAYGKQPDPKPGVHNSGWVQDPAVSLRNDTLNLFPVLEKYVKDIISTYKNDDRILLWDLYNEPGNRQHGMGSMPLLKNVFKWARDINPSQPISAGIWFFKYNEMNQFQIENSDVITYHNYQIPMHHTLQINMLNLFGRPLICTEYMARRNNSRFDNTMPLLKQNNVGAINWGFVSGKTNTIFAWDEPRPNDAEPPLWFHDIYRQNGTPFDQAEVDIIKATTGKTSNVKRIDPKNFDTTIDGKKVSLFTLRNRNGMTAQITNFGGKVVNLWVPDKDHAFRDIVTGLNTIGEYQKTTEVYFGSLIGRYGNRIDHGKFKLNGKSYQLATNNGANHLHGGPKGFHNVVWEARAYKNNQNEDALELQYLAADKEEGYPGNLKVNVIYTLTSNNELKIEYSATTDQPTIVNLTHHSFFNLHGFNSGNAKSINTHVLQLNAAKYTPTNPGLIPTGEIASVENTPMDFQKPTMIGERVNEKFPDLINGKGYDHNWVLKNNGDKISEAGSLYEPESGIVMTVITDQPAVQFYGGNFFNGTATGKYGEVYAHRTSFALETQYFPDSPNHSNFPSTVLNPGQKYSHLCIYKFSVK